MDSSKLLSILKVLDGKEMNALYLYVLSPCFNNSNLAEEITNLFRFVQEHHPVFSPEKVTPENAHEFIYPGKSFKQSRINLLMSKLFKIVQSFIADQYEVIPAKKLREALAMAKFYKAHNLSHAFDLKIKTLRKFQHKEPLKEGSFYFHEFLINQEITLFESLYNHKKGDMNISTTLKSLDIFYLITKLEYVCALLTVSKDNAVDLQDSIQLLRNMAPLIENGVLDVFIVKIYYQAFLLLLREGEESTYRKYLELLEEVQQADFSRENVQALHAHARNYCIEQYNNGKKEFLAEAFRLYKDHLAKGYLYYNDGLLPNTLQSITNTGLKLGASGWVRNFLEMHKNRIVGTQHPEVVYDFNLANYFFYINDYDNALMHLAGSYENAYYNLVAKRLEIKIYYETDSVLLDSKINSFKIFIFRNAKISEQRKKANNSFIDMLKQILHYKTKSNQERINKLRQKVEGKKKIAEKEWLLEKLDSMQ